jgi:hypothetical protein
MSHELPRPVLDAADITAITQLVLRERESRDLGLWQRMRDCFHPDSKVRITWFTGSGPDFVAGSIDMARRGVLAKHRLGPVLVALNGERAVATLGGIIDIPVRVHDVPAILSAYGRFLYRVERRAGQWRLMSFECIYQRDELTPAIPGQTLVVPAEAVAQFRPAYRMLAYHLHLNGYTVDPDLAGEDRPETVSALLADAYAWAGLSL